MTTIRTLLAITVGFSVLLFAYTQASFRQPGLVLVESHTASNSASLDFTRITSEFDEYQLEFVNLVTASIADLEIRASTDGGSTWLSSGYEYVRTNSSTSGVGPSSVSSTSASSVMLFPTVDIAQPYGTSGRLTLYDPMNASLNKSMTFMLSTVFPTPRRYTENGSGFVGTTSPLTAIQILASSGNLASGTARLYGFSR